MILLFIGAAIGVAMYVRVVRMYCVGNSLTCDMQPKGVGSMALTIGVPMIVGEHVKAGTPLNKIWDNPDDFIKYIAVKSFTEMLPNNKWDIVTLQPHRNSTLDQEKAAFKKFVDLTRKNPKNKDTIFYIYAAWPKYNKGDNYQEKWNQDLPEDRQSILCKKYFDLLIEELRLELPGIKIYMIPVGEVLNRIDQEIKNGKLKDVKDICQFYRDSIHASMTAGRYVAGVTTFATVLKRNPKYVRKPKEYYTYMPKQKIPDHEVLNSALMIEVKRIVWDVVKDHPYSGISLRKRK